MNHSEITAFEYDGKFSPEHLAEQISSQLNRRVEPRLDADLCNPYEVCEVYRLIIATNHWWNVEDHVGQVVVRRSLNDQKDTVLFRSGKVLKPLFPRLSIKLQYKGPLLYRTDTQYELSPFLFGKEADFSTDFPNSWFHHQHH